MQPMYYKNTFFRLSVFNYSLNLVQKVQLMEQDRFNLEDYQSLSLFFESKKQELLKINDLRVISEYRIILQKKIKYQKEFIKNFYELKNLGRGGNNVSENIKKCIFSLLRKIYPQCIYNEIMQSCIKKYKLKSQKELIFFIFLFLLKLSISEKIQYDSIGIVIQRMHMKIRKFIQNSQNRMQEQPERAEFHRKNVGEFEKYCQLNLDFRNNRSIIDLKDQLRGLYLRKLKDYRKAEIKIINFIASEPCLRDVFRVRKSSEKLEQTD